MPAASSLHTICDSKNHLNQECDARWLYESLLQTADAAQQNEHSAAYLSAQLKKVEGLECELPREMTALGDWVDKHCAQVGDSYAEYLTARRAGAPRQYFSTRSAALFYLQAIAPTKLVDGAWLYGLTRHWQDSRFRPLITTYLDELGDGDARQNHVLLYQELLEKNGCSTMPGDERLYAQGAVQLALAHNSDQFLPEVIGYNLGYEQPPLHMLISAYELKELGIDPYYFTLHVTTDNASTGHARLAAASVQRLAPAVNRDRFYQRVRNGYMLNEVGPDAANIRASFDLQQKTIDMLENKRFYGRNMHSGYCRVEGKTVNDWLQVPGQIEPFLQALIKRGWIRLNEDPANSRFWQLIAAPKAPMAGVFNAFEAQLIYDWIAGEWLHSGGQTPGVARLRPSASVPVNMEPGPAIAAVTDDEDAGRLRQDLKGLPTAQKMTRLIQYMSPDRHTTPAGLLATRMFSEIYRA